jgi:hypothetical protein
MAVESPQVHRERVVRATRQRIRSRARLAVQLIWTVAYLAGGAIALAEGDRGAALIGLVGGTIFALLGLVAALRRRRLRRRSWRPLSPVVAPGSLPGRSHPAIPGRFAR